MNCQREARLISTSKRPINMLERTWRYASSKQCTQGQGSMWKHERPTGSGQLVLRRYKQQVQGYNGLNSAQPGCLLGSTRTLPSRHNEAQRPRQDGHAVIQAWGTAHVPRVVSREVRIQLPSEKSQHHRNQRNQNTSRCRERKLAQLQRPLLIQQPLLLQHQEGIIVHTIGVVSGYKSSHGASPARSQPEELYCDFRYVSPVNPDLKLGQRL